MDVKFPIENYKRYIQESFLVEKQKYKKLFATDIRQIVKSINSKKYIIRNIGGIETVLTPADIVWIEVD